MRENISKTVFLYIAVGLAVPIILFVNVLLVPEPYSHPLINVAIAPTRLMPFLENGELLDKLTQWVFGRQTPNYAPITMVILNIFWFAISMVALYFVRLFMSRKKST